MTTLLLPPDEVAKVRTLKGQVAYVLAVMILLDRHYPGRGFRPDEVALIAGMDERTAAKQLKELSVLDRAILTGAGYVLTDGGRAMFLAPPADIEALALSPAALATPNASQALSPELPTVEKALQAQALQTIDLEATDTLPAKPPYDNTHNVCALVVEVNTLTLLSKDTSTTTFLETQIARELKVPQVFGKSHILFGESVLVVRNVTVERALAVFAHVYSQKGSFQKPARVAFAMMRDNKEPREDFAKDPWKHLPTDYLEALNVVRHQCNLCPGGEMFPTSETVNAHLQAAHPEPVEIVEDVTVPVATPAPDGNDRIAGAWDYVLGQVQKEMHRAPFETWVKGTKAVRLTGNTLYVSASNSATCEWLESRIQRTAERMLVGILCQAVTVKFIVAQLSTEAE